jgi:hypothetical protein
MRPFKLNGKKGHYGLPIPQGQRPLLADIVQRQEKQLQLCLIAMELAPALGHLAQGLVHRLNGIGRLNDAPYLR